MSANVLAVDFGTSNSAAAIWSQNGPRLLPLEPAKETLPTAVFFPTGGTMRIGSEAGEALLDGVDGRYMRALKSVLGTELFHESRLVGGKRQTLSDIVTRFLGEVKARAEAQTGQVFTSAVSGRPVHFHSSNPDRDARAAKDLADCYHGAGFETLRFVHEPEAAALAAGRGEGLGLVVDIGGGTSDFSVFRDGIDGVEILASHGIRLGGTDFDQALSLDHVMPLLGHGSRLRREMGAGELPMPKALFVDLATWAKIPFLYGGDTRRAARDLHRAAVEPQLTERLMTVLEETLGHDIAFAVERGKIAANGPEGRGSVDLRLIESGLSAQITAPAMARTLDADGTQLEFAMRQTLAMAGVGPADISRVVLVGGSSLMSLVEAAASSVCPTARVLREAAFTAVVEGLARAIPTTLGTPG